jgi:hypothetical protein
MGKVAALLFMNPEVVPCSSNKHSTIQSRMESQMLLRHCAVDLETKPSNRNQAPRTIADAQLAKAINTIIVSGDGRCSS